MNLNKMKFNEFIEIQPSVKLDKGTNYSFIAMEDIEPNTKYVLHDFRLNKIYLQLEETLWYPEFSCIEYARLSTLSEGFHGAKGDSVDPTRDRRV